MALRFIGIGHRGLGLAILHCAEIGKKDQLIAIYLRDLFLTMEYFERVQSGKFELLNLRDFEPSQYPMRGIYVQQWRLAPMRKAKDLGKSVVTLAELDEHRIAREKIHLHSNWKLFHGMLPNLVDVREQTPLLHSRGRA